MIRFVPISEPADFESKVRRRGMIWLSGNSDKRPKDFWKECKSALANGFRNLCAYSAMYEPVGTVDHYFSTKTHRHLAYEWSNYRYASGWINSSKQDKVVLDPFQVDDGWFEIILPSLQLVITAEVPQEKRQLAEYTLTSLHLCEDERVIRQRQEWYRMYLEEELSFAGLEKKAPLIARAVRKQMRV